MHFRSDPRHRQLPVGKEAGLSPAAETKANENAIRFLALHTDFMNKTHRIDVLDVSTRADVIKGLPASICGLCDVVQGLLVHDAAVLTLYGDPPAGVRINRETLTVVDRIDAALAKSPLPLSRARPPFDRQVGTCRDFAAMLCAFARSSGYQARVRCGFATYLGGARPEDHWLVEYRERSDVAWKIADPQMDEAHRQDLEIAFDHLDLPRDQFMCADEAWRLWRRNDVPAENFGHGKHRGAGLVFVNLVRDALARKDILRSSWDAWRDLGDLDVSLPADVIVAGDRIIEGDLAELRALADKGPLAVLKT